MWFRNLESKIHWLLGHSIVKRLKSQIITFQTISVAWEVNFYRCEMEWKTFMIQFEKEKEVWINIYYYVVKKSKAFS